MKFMILFGMWLAGLVGSAFGLGFTILGYFFESGPGGGMEGPGWKVIIIGLLSAMVGILIGSYLARVLMKRWVCGGTKPSLALLISMLAVVSASAIAFVAGWETGFFMGKVMGSISGITWKAVLLYAPIMGAVYSLPFCLSAGLIHVIFSYMHLRRREIKSLEP